MVTTACWTILSSKAATPNGRCRPSSFCMYTLLEGNARYAPRWTRPCRSINRSSSPASYSCQVTPSTPLIYYGRLARALQAHEMNFGLPVPKELLGEEEQETVRAKHE